MKNFRFLLIALSLIPSVSHAQSRRTVKDMKIKSVFIEQKELKKNELVITRLTNNVFDKQGNLISEIERNADSTYKKYDNYVFNKHSDVVEHQEYDKNGRLILKTISTYDNLKDKTEESTYDSTNTLIERVRFKYNNFGQKEEELTLYRDDKLKKKTIYKYDSHGSVVERSSYNEKGELIFCRKYTYQYYN